MRVYLIQHGEATSEEEDPERPLTDKGRKAVESMSKYIATLGLGVTCIIHSGKLRARQTAEIFARHLSLLERVCKQKGLGPMDELQEVKQLIQRTDQPLMIIGHLPHLSRLVSLLTVGSAEQEVVSFQKGGVVCLIRKDDGWLLAWALTPELIQSQK
jgi:phosphohistidine phosphatase